MCCKEAFKTLIQNPDARTVLIELNANKIKTTHKHGVKVTEASCLNQLVKIDENKVQEKKHHLPIVTSILLQYVLQMHFVHVLYVSQAFTLS